MEAFRIRDYLRDGLDVVWANLLSALALCLCSLALPLAPLLLVNWLAGVKLAKREGKPIALESLFKAAHASDRWLGAATVGLGIGIASSCFVLPGLIVGGLLLFTPCLLADRPGLPWVTAIKAAVRFGRENLAAMIKLLLVAWGAPLVGIGVSFLGGLFELTLVQLGGALLTLLSALISLPLGSATLYMAYEDQRTALETFAAEGGIAL